MNLNPTKGDNVLCPLTPIEIHGNELIQTKIIQPKPKQRRVRFQVNENNEVSANVLIYPSFPDDCAVDLYYSRAEKKQMVQKAHAQCRAFAGEYPVLIDELEVAYSATPLSLEKEAAFLCQWVCCCGRSSRFNMRGLEAGFVESYRKNRKHAVRRILRRYKELVEDETSRKGIEQELHHFSQNESRRARVFAYRMGVADSQAAGNQ